MILPDEQKIPAKVLAYDTDHDLTALSVNAYGLPTVELGNSRELQPGQFRNTWISSDNRPQMVRLILTA